MPGLSFQSRVEGVTHVARCICDGSGVPPAPKLWFGLPFSPSEARGVDHCVRTMCVASLRPVAPSGSGPPTDDVWLGHGDPVQPVSDVGGVHGASRNIECPAGVTFRRQISADSVEPSIASRAANLFPNDDSRSNGPDQSK